MITASLVLYKTKQSYIDTILRCIENSKCIEKLFVIDNDSTPEMANFFSNYSYVEYIKHENTGYGSSHNIALYKAIEMGSIYHVILNPDIEFGVDVISELAKYMNENKDVVYILPNVIYPNGERQYLCKLLPTPNDLFIRRFFPRSKKNIKRNEIYCLKNSGYNRIMNPPCLSGCFMFLRCSTLKENNLFFDERYFMYMEDFDLMRRLHRVGKTIFYPKLTIIHNHEKESYKSKRMLKIHIQSAIKYFNKYGWIFDKERRLMNRLILNEIDVNK